MNREEAKTKLMTIYGSLSEELKKAIDVLVDAPKSEWEQMGEMGNLFAEATKDCISRKEAIDYVKSYIHEIITESGTDKNEHTNNILRMIVDGLNEFTPITPDLSEFIDELYKLAYERGKAEGQEWIPVIEKMPENGEVVLFCDIDEDVMIGYHVKGRAGTHFTQCDTYEDMKNVKAWMPLPAPYKQEGKE